MCLGGCGEQFSVIKELGLCRLWGIILSIIGMPKHLHNNVFAHGTVTN